MEEIQPLLLGKNKYDFPKIRYFVHFWQFWQKKGPKSE